MYEKNKKNKKNKKNNLLRFAYSWGHRLKIVVYWRKRKYTESLKLKTTAKLKDKRTSIATTRKAYTVIRVLDPDPYPDPH